MSVQGRDCSLVIKTAYREVALPYSEETIRESVSLLTGQAAIEGDGICGAIRKSAGVTGCVVTPLTIETAPLLFALALGEAGLHEFVSETRDLYRYKVFLRPYEDSAGFDLIQRREKLIIYEGCRVSGFELRIFRGQALKLKLDIAGEYGPRPYPYEDTAKPKAAERFKEDGVKYEINGNKTANIYSLTLTTAKKAGTHTEVRIHRALCNEELPSAIESLTVTARLLRDHYEWRLPGTFRLHLSKLLLMADETAVDAPDAVIGPLRYYAAGNVSAEVFGEIKNGKWERRGAGSAHSVFPGRRASVLSALYLLC
jgi:hypothetical protein